MSKNSISLAGAIIIRERGVPLCRSSGLPSRITSQPPITQSAFCVPEPHCQRPFTRNPPGSATALPRGANTPPSSTSGPWKIARAESGGSSASTRARRRADEHAPRRGAVGLRERLDRVHRVGGRQLEPAVHLGHAHPEEARAREARREVGGDPARALDLVGARAQLAAHRARRGTVSIDGGAAHRASSPRSPSRFAMLFFCMFDEPPTIGMPSRSRTWRSMSWPSASP